MATSGVELATAYVTLAVSTRGMERDIRRQFAGVERDAGASGARAGRAMGGSIVAAAKSFAAPLAAAFGVGVVVSQLSEAVTAGSDFEQAVGAAEAVFKNDAAAIKANATGAATSLGLAKEEYLRLSTLLGAGLKNQGIKDFAAQSDALVRIGADLAAQFGGSTSDAVATLAAVMRGEYDSIERYGISLSENIIKAQAASMGLLKGAKNLDKIKAAQNNLLLAERNYAKALKESGKGSNQALAAESRLIRSRAALGKALKGEKAEMSTNIRAQAALALVSKQSADAQGAFAREADTFAGKQQRLSASWDNIKTQIGTALLPTLTGLSSWFLDKGIPAIKAFGTGLSGIGAILFKGDFRGASKTFGWAEDSGQVDFLFRMRDALLAARDAAVRFGTWVRDDLWPALQDGWERIQPGLQEAKQILSDAFGGGTGADMKSFGQILTEVVIPAVAEFVNVYLPIWARNIAAVIQAVKTAWAVFETWRDIMLQVAQVITGAFTGVTRMFAGMFRAISKIPGFGWAADAADYLDDAARQADQFGDALSRIQDKSVQVKVDFTTTGQVKLPNGVAVDMGTLRAREHGGPVRKGQPYVVGEKRAELFVPDQNGKILPRVPETSAPAGMGGFPSPREYADAVYDALRSSRLVVDTRDNALATQRFINSRGQM